MRAKEIGGAAPAAWLAGIGLAVIVVVPFAAVVLQAIFPNLGRGSFAEPFSLLLATLSDIRLVGMAGNTVLLGLAVVAASACLAVPLGMVRALYRVPLAPLWDVLLLVPFMIPPYIATLGWIMTLQPRGYLEQIAGFNLAPVLFSLTGMTLVMTFNTFPVVYFAVSRTVEAVGSRYAGVGRVFGASPLRAFFHITLPLSAPGLAASLLLVFAAAIEEYGTPAALGRRAGFEVLVTGIDSRVSDWPIDLPGAAALSLLLVLLSLAAFLVQRWILNRRSYQTVGGKPQAAEKQPLGRLAAPVLAAFAAVSFLATGVPMLAVLATALTRTISGGLRLDNLGGGNFAAVFGGASGALAALGNSLLLGVLTAAVTGVIGAVAAYAVVKTRIRGRTAIDVLTVLPNALPGIVVAVGLILAWNMPALPFTPYNTPLILLFAYCCILLPQTARYATAAFLQIGDNLEAAARVCGASAPTAFRRILLPLIFPSLASAMLLVFALASRELVASVVVAPVGMQTIALFIWRQFEQGSVGLGMAMAFVTIVITTLLPLAFLALLRRTGLVAA
ncbi:ABC-type Fe3+ transport system, permease component [uncultured Pleomorphomonas sp.]|uniref:ABC-type Fe3+ transport system, permease component n=1 Tax=uncultured Pleomorphomonas sp. TaxID=442121 RepID=A0A212LH47_9HYPH|nr:iron ABC transporter permease [uncultured Pleomorphomonas sp.]SCM76891.1 ABC-type Fe3+ transport system, permease component [uncultured Pleomorphomonas sp.]